MLGLRTEIPKSRKKYVNPVGKINYCKNADNWAIKTMMWELRISLKILYKTLKGGHFVSEKEIHFGNFLLGVRMLITFALKHGLPIH